MGAERDHRKEIERIRAKIFQVDEEIRQLVGRTEEIEVTKSQIVDAALEAESLHVPDFSEQDRALELLERRVMHLEVVKSKLEHGLSRSLEGYKLHLVEGAERDKLKAQKDLDQLNVEEKNLRHRLFEINYVAWAKGLATPNVSEQGIDPKDFRKYGMALETAEANLLQCQSLTQDQVLEFITK